ncbi:GntR family transcriptional regulator [Sulfodiicoccus acidiphilus]|uniref:GntR family transcriptional regulator n=1 Tax=Sulfodiicoccus acidiphilus TaxID=1670455 RepID=A0A348B3Q6_9CREN|nr:PLP-dependent aminotransferase family protein [Sulfodiicoccus acidiphilus]BBD72808.1 GntR family transcriptional regulator [Sulfodiicoccus acidiphilus]GGU04324.1 GntR family transcriptional regulator [Sulfodiicoccus acidiphilus]
MVSRIGKEIELSPVEMASRYSSRALYNLAAGSPDPSTIPVGEIMNSYDRVLSDLGPRALGYPGAGGQESLVKEIENFLPFLGLSIRKGERLVVTSGAQHAIELIAKYLLENEVVVAENPTFVETLTPMKLRSSVVLPVSLDERGMSVDELESLTRTVKVSIVYIIPNCHNPAGVTTCLERRKRLAELAEERNFYILEDDPYRPISTGVPPPVKSFDNNGRVIYVSTFSKILAPGLRIGFILANQEVAEKLALLEQNDFSTSTINQYVVADLLKRGVIQGRTEQLSSHYGRKMKILVESLRENRLDDFNPPSCGFFLLLNLHKDADSVFHTALTKGLLFVPAGPFFLRGGETYARLSVAVAQEEHIVKGVRVLKEVLSQD